MDAMGLLSPAGRYNRNAVLRRAPAWSKLQRTVRGTVFAMNTQRGFRTLVAVAALCLVSTSIALAWDDPGLTKEQIKEFLLNAKVIGAKETGKGVTHPSRLTLSDGKVTHDASFQPVDEHKDVMKLATRTEFGFVDSYKYNIAAY
jgi:hypothetical protein